ncbi:MAG TPA: energy-coupling factor ABC transporter permease [Bryobacteraceae bacterium]|jgi:cobalt/nickel transport system permease protein|nr:energy-coupling factor ABC transporter permease [Bryobacteraceae bacterium]
MHIPDNFLTPPVWATLDCVAAPAIAVVSRRARASADLSQTSLLGVLGAFVFAAQMVNFPVGVGTSGHLVGGTLLACIVGPWAAALVMTSILLIQALVFQDGGILALGANVFNMALMGVLVGYLPARLLAGSKWRNLGVFVGGTSSVLISGLLALSELSASHIHISSAMVEVSLLVFLVNALVEGAITVSALRAIERLKPGITILGRNACSQYLRPFRAPRLSFLIAFAAMMVVLCGVVVGSRLPDGLERLALRLGVPLAHPVLHAPLSDYYIRQFGRNWPSQATAGLLGIICIYLICATASHLLARARRSYSQ